MNLAWFPFNIKDFLANTKRLNTEAKGAYLLLMLDYYEQGKPPPDDDLVLGTITELSADAWARHRKVLEPLFRVEDGVWNHDRIEKERLEAGSKLARSHARAKAAGDAYAAKIASQKPQAGSKSVSEPKKANEAVSKPAPSRLKAPPGDRPRDDTLTLTIKKDSLSVSQDENLEEEGAVPADQVHRSVDEPEDDTDGIGTPIDPAWKPNENQIATCKFDGATPEIIEAERVAFISNHLSKGNISHDWDASWALWWKRWKEYVAAQAAKAERKSQREATTLPARIEVNNVVDYDKHCAFWVKVGRWPKGIGPDPDSLGCKAPLEILIKHGLRKETA